MQASQEKSNTRYTVSFHSYQQVVQSNEQKLYTSIIYWYWSMQSTSP